MKLGHWAMILGVGTLGMASSAVAVSVPIVNEPAVNTVYPVTGPYESSGNVFNTLESGVLYSNTTETGSRFNPGTGGSPAGTGTQQDITFDDIPIPNARLGGATAIDVTKVTVGIRRAGNAPATDLSLFWSTAATTVTTPDTELDVPFFPVATQSLASRNTAAFITELVTFGDGTNPLFTAPLNSSLLNGFGTFLLGVQFSNGDSLNGWRLTSGIDTNANVMWIYDTDATNPEGSFNFGAAPNPAATFYIIVEGTAVPEPAALGLLAATGVLGLRRRR